MGENHFNKSVILPKRGAGNKIIMNAKGMTLIEIIVVIVLLSIIGLFTFDFVGKGVETYIIASNQVGLLAEAKLAMERMTREIRDANIIVAVVSNPSGDSINIIKSHPTDLDIATEITFQKNGSTLERIRVGYTTEPLADNVSSFNVTNDSNEIKLELTLSLAGGENVTLHTKVYPRNLAFEPSEDFGGAKFHGRWKEYNEWQEG